MPGSESFREFLLARLLRQPNTSLPIRQKRAVIYLDTFVRRKTFGKADENAFLCSDSSFSLYPARPRNHNKGST